MDKKPKRPIVITGGHMTPALAVMAEMRARGYNNFIWVGQKYNQTGATEKSPEYNTVAAYHDTRFVDLRAGKLVRSWGQSPREFAATLLNLLRIPWGFAKAVWILLRYRPSIIVSFGGFIALPVVIVAKFFGKPVITHEQTVTTGLANRLIAKYVDKILISWPTSAKYYPKEKVILTGNPVRQGIFNGGDNRFQFANELPIVYITGGNQGSWVINEVVFNSLADLLTFANVIHQTGNSPETLSALQKLEIPEELRSHYIHQSFFSEEEVAEIFKKSILIISRSGANTTTEVLALGKPAIFVPIPWVTQNEQFLNAQMAAETGIAAVLEEKDLSRANLLRYVQMALSFAHQGKSFHNSDIGIAQEAARKLVNPDAHRLIADKIEELLRQ